jgi:hypothetical protein
MIQRLMSAIVFLLACPFALAKCPDPVQLYSPASGTVTINPKVDFSWSPTTTTGYGLVLIRNGVQVPVPAGCRNSPSPDCSGTLKPGRYEWYVRTYNNDKDCADGTESKPPRYSLQINGCNEAPSGLAPDGDNDVPAGAKLTWIGDPAAKYEVFLEEGGQCKATTPTAKVTGTSASVALKSNTKYAWRVGESPDASCPTPKFSNCATFTTCTPPGSFTLLEPDIRGTDVTLSWTAASGASEYQVTTTWNGSSSVQPRTTSRSMCLALPKSPIGYTWFVTAFRGQCSTRSNEGKFRIESCATPTLEAPKDNSETKPGQDIVFRWASPKASCQEHRYTYILRIRPVEGGKSNNYNSSPLEETSLTLSAGTLAPGRYRWWVAVVYDTKVCTDGQSDVWEFTKK